MMRLLNKSIGGCLLEVGGTRNVRTRSRLRIRRAWVPQVSAFTWRTDRLERGSHRLRAQDRGATSDELRAALAPNLSHAQRSRTSEDSRSCPHGASQKFPPNAQGENDGRRASATHRKGTGSDAPRHAPPLKLARAPRNVAAPCGGCCCAQGPRGVGPATKQEGMHFDMPSALHFARSGDGNSRIGRTLQGGKGAPSMRGMPVNTFSLRARHCGLRRALHKRPPHMRASTPHTHMRAPPPPGPTRARRARPAG